MVCEQVSHPQTGSSSERHRQAGPCQGQPGWGQGLRAEGRRKVQNGKAQHRVTTAIAGSPRGGLFCAKSRQKLSCSARTCVIEDTSTFSPRRGVVLSLTA